MDQESDLSQRARQVFATSAREAAQLGHEQVGTEHLLLGLLAEAQGVAATVLRHLEVDVQQVRSRVLEIIRSEGPAMVDVPRPLTTRGKRAVALARAAAADLGHTYLGTEHLLLGLIGEEQGIAAQLLREHGVTMDRAWAETRRLLGAPGNASTNGSTTTDRPSGLA